MVVPRLMSAEFREFRHTQKANVATFCGGGGCATTVLTVVMMPLLQNHIYCSPGFFRISKKRPTALYPINDIHLNYSALGLQFASARTTTIGGRVYGTIFNR